jgi:hypothetical protein
VRAELDELHFRSHPVFICKRAVNKYTSDHFFIFIFILSVLGFRV